MTTENTIEIVLDYGTHTESRRVEIVDGVAKIHVTDARLLTGEPVWAKVEQNGHRTFTGRVTDFQRWGVTMCQVDVPGKDAPIIISPSSIFAITPCSEETARALAPNSTETISSWWLREHVRPALPEPSEPVEAEVVEADEEGVPF